jgi:small subunit ribosomal protein S3
LGHKVHPNGFRLGAYRSWEANWFASDKDYTKLLHEDLDMRRLILRRLRNAGIAKIETERSSNAQMTVTIHTAKPGIVIGKGGSSVDQLREDLEKRFQNRVRISIQEIKQPELDAQLVAENIASQIERRISYRRAMKQSILRTMRAGAKGVRVAMGGRLRGSEMARREWDREGRVPLHTLRADIDFGRATARTTFGVIGVKVWIYKDLLKPRRRGGEVEEEIYPQPETQAPEEAAHARATLTQQVPAGAHAETPAQDPGAPAVAEPTVEKQVAAEEAGSGQRRRSPRAAGKRGAAAEPGRQGEPVNTEPGDAVPEPSAEATQSVEPPPVGTETSEGADAAP